MGTAETPDKRKTGLQKEYKDLYMPKNKACRYTGARDLYHGGRQGDPQYQRGYKNAIEILYGLSYSIKMSKMGGNAPEATLNMWCRRWKACGGWTRDTLTEKRLKQG